MRLGLVREGLEQFPAVALLGLRQIGKTSLALELGTLMPSVYLDLEAPADRAKLADPALYLSALAARLVILDEVQRMPELFATLRGLIDAEQRQGQRSGRFLLLVLRLQPLHANVAKRLVKSAKVYVRDSGLLHSLLGLDDRDALYGHPVVGGSWEGFVVETLLSIASERCESDSIARQQTPGWTWCWIFPAGNAGGMR